MVVNATSAFQLKLKYFENYRSYSNGLEEHHNSKLPDSNGNLRRRTNGEVFNNINHTESFIVSTNKGTIPEKPLSLKNMLNEVRTEFGRYTNGDKSQSNDHQRILNGNSSLEESIPRRKSDNTPNKSEGLSIKRTINQVRASFENINDGWSHKKEVAVYVPQTGCKNSSLDDSSSRRTPKRNFNVLLKGSLYINPFLSLLQLNESVEYDSDDEDLYYLDLFEY